MMAMQSARRTPANPTGPNGRGYDALAGEYYDPVRHPTCAAFRALSAMLIGDQVRAASGRGACGCEIGTGRSIVAEILEGSEISLRGWWLTDRSARMLAHSRPAIARGARLIVADARDLPFAASTFDVIVASLADAFNDQRLWREMATVLRPGGVCLLTLPSFAWAEAFRGAEAPAMRAEFLSRSGRVIAVPSRIYPEVVQRAMIEDAGLVVEAAAIGAIRHLPSARVAPKLMPQRGADAPVVDAYRVCKPAGATQRRHRRPEAEIEAQ